MEDWSFHTKVLSLAGDDVDDDGGADEGGDGVKGDDTTLARQIADKIAYQGYYRATE